MIRTPPRPSRPPQARCRQAACLTAVLLLGTTVARASDDDPLDKQVITPSMFSYRRRHRSRRLEPGQSPRTPGTRRRDPHPDWYAARFTGGNTLGVGFGGYYSIIGNGSLGPCEREAQYASSR